MAFEVEEDDAHPRGRSNATVTDEQGDCHRKGKGVIGASSSGVAGMSTMPENTVEVVTQNGRRVKLKGGIESPWSHGNPIMDWLCNSRSESTPILDEYDDNELESPIPSRVLMDELGMDGEVTALKRKLDFNTRDGKKKRKAGLVDIEEEIEDDVDSDSSEGSPINVELCDSSSDDGTGDEFGDEWEFRGPSGGGACEVGPSGGGACEVGASGDGSRDGAMHEQAAPNPPLRPRSTRLKKVPVKELYK